MPRILSFRRLFFFSILFAIISLASLSAQEEASPDPEKETNRPKASDSASQKLIRNFLTVSGGAEKYRDLQNVLARGTLEEGGNIKDFELIETMDGKRHLKLSWRHLGRDYAERFVYDGGSSWRQELKPERKPAQNYSGQDAIHFSNQRWLLQPFVPPLVNDYVFKYQGSSKVNGRSCYVVVGYGRKNIRSWFYFDREKFLLLRWGGFGQIAGVREYMDYRSSRFNRVAGVLLPKEIDLLAENAAFGKIQFDSIVANQAIDPEKFTMPEVLSPVLRQRPSKAK